MVSPRDPDLSAVALLDPGRREALDALAASSDRKPAELLNDAIDAYLDLDRWQRAEIEAGLKDAEAGNFASEADVAAAFSGS